MDEDNQEKCETREDDPQLELGLKNYLDCEVLLNTLFAKLDYCSFACLSNEIGNYRVKMNMPGDRTQFPGYMGCCPHNSFKFCNYKKVSNRTLLEKRRLEKYGKPNEANGVCDYHTKNEGCILKDHKSPICLAYVCPELFHFMFDSHGIKYDKDEVEETLELILSGKQSLEKLEEFKGKIQDFIKSVEARA